jgi:hypothetical protein
MSEVSKDRRKLTRRIRDAWPRLEPLIEAGYPLIDIWEDWTEFKVSYRHFIRTIRKIRKAQSVTRIVPSRTSIRGRDLPRI